MSGSTDIYLVYDGECPVCSAYCKAVALRALDPNFRIVNAREDHPVVADINRLGFDMDEGFVLRLGGQYYHGDEAIHQLAFLTTRVGLLNRLNYWVFSNRTLSRLLYPVLRTGRNTLLRILGRRKLNAG
jgi:predicted DCC family thiol-disulfide oxidoreductase YuxK